MRVLHVVDALGLGGAERHLIQVARYLAGRGVEQRIAELYPYSNAFAAELSAAGIEVVSLGRTSGMASLPSDYSALLDHCRSFRPDLISTQLPFSDLVGRLAGKRLGIPVVTFWQNTTYDRSTWINMTWRATVGMSMTEGVDRLTSRWADLYIAVSGPVRDSYARALGVPLERCVVIPNTIDFSRFPSVVPERPERPGLRLINIARHVPHKGVRTLIDALALIDEKLDVSVDLFGEGPETLRLKTLALRRDAIGRMRFRGLKRDLVPDLLAADAFVFPSFREGLSLAYLEALAAGLPVIASDILPNRAIDPHARATLFFPPGDAEALAARIKTLLEDQTLRRRLSQAGRTLIEPFRIEAVGPQIFEAFQNVCRGQLPAKLGFAGSHDAERRK